MIQGCYVYVWQTSKCDGGDLTSIVDKGRTYGTGFIFKHDDGGNTYHNTTTQYGDTDFGTLVKYCEDKGIAAGAWGYHYGYPRGTDLGGYIVQGPDAELQQAVACVQSAKPRFYALDNEGEYEGNPNTAVSVAQSLRNNVGPDYSLISACLPVIRYHLSSPYRQWADANFIQSPQFYWSMFRNTYALSKAVDAEHMASWQRLQAAGVKWDLPVPRLNDHNASIQLLTADTLLEYWQEDSTLYDIPSNPWCPAYMDAPLAGNIYACTDAEVVHFLSLLDPQATPSVWCWSYQHMDDAAWVRLQKVSEWVALTDPKHKLQSLLDQATALYSQANDIFSQAIPLLEARLATC